MLSGDQNIVDVQFSVLYQVSDPEAYLFHVENPENGSAGRRKRHARIVGRRPAQDIFRDNRAGIANDVRGIIQKTLDDYGAALRSMRSRSRMRRRRAKWPTHLTKCSAPSRTRTVSSKNPTSIPTRSWARRAVKARRSGKTLLPTRTVSCRKPQGEAQRFTSVYDQYVKAPEVTRKRLFLETMESVLKDSNKVIVEQERPGRRAVSAAARIAEAPRD